MDPLSIGLVAFAAFLLWKAQSSTIDPATGLPVNSSADPGSDLSFGVNIVMDTQTPKPGRLSPVAIAQVASIAGFQGNDLITAVAVALAESGGNPNAYNPEIAAGTPTGQGSFGLWQIYTKAHPEFAGVDLTDPQNNANAAFAVYRAAGNTFRPWSTFKNGAFTAHLDAAQGGADVVA